MYINQQKLIRLPVFTESGEKLGHVHDFEIDLETHQIRKYLVVSGLISKDVYYISPAQIVSVTDDKIIVEDATLKNLETASKKRMVPPALDTPFSTSQNTKTLS